MKNQKEHLIVSGFVIGASAQFNLEKVVCHIANGTSTLTMKTNQNVTGAKEQDSAHSMKFFKKTNKKEKTNYETQRIH